MSKLLIQGLTLNPPTDLANCYNVKSIGGALLGGGIFGGIAQGLNKMAIKPRGGIAGGGASGKFTSFTRRWFPKAGGKALGRTSVLGGAAIWAGAGIAALHTKCLSEYLGCWSGCPDVCP